ncbi:hypothetical protein [Streptococcus pyogenes SSI-1]|nr:hypothetical cytosolic protein [Streptococcus pyogenes MGAS10270]ABF37126.1 hypothetical cytosolic protein [Streptococcus pyogenes MGAS10750]BAC63255.1 hypothetical protein [Streptococcus pyogenes SSI-1]
MGRGKDFQKAKSCLERVMIFLGIQSILSQNEAILT